MTSKRESILSAIASALASTSGVSGRVYRSRVEPLSRAESPAIVIEPVSDQAEQNTSLPTLDWSMTVRVVVIVRGSVPDQLADPIIESAHSKIMADLTLGGYAIDVQPSGVDFDLREGDQPSGVITLEYVVRYRTSVANLATGT